MTSSDPDGRTGPLISPPAQTFGDRTVPSRRNRVFGGRAAFACQASSTGLNFLVQTLFARALGTRGFGQYSYAINLAQLVAVPSDVGSSSSISRIVPEYRARGDRAGAHGAVRAAQFTTLTVGCVLAASVFALGVVAHWGPVTPGIAGIAMISAPLFALTLVQMNALRALGGVFTALAPSLVAQPALLLILSLALHDALDVKFVVVATVATLAMAAVVQAALIDRGTRPSETGEGVVRRYELRRWRQLSTPMLAINITQLAFQRLDIVVIGLLIDARSAGVYALANRMANLTSMMANSYATMIAPQLSHLHWSGRSDDAGTLALRSLRVTFAPAVGLFLAFLVAGHWLLGIFGPGFSSGYWALVIYAGGQLIDASCGPVGYLALMIGRERALFRQTVVGAVIAVVGYAVLIPTMGIVGAALANALGTVYKNVAAQFLVRQNGYRVSLIRALRRLPDDRLSVTGSAH